jgi:hypothetical protein
MSQPEQAQDSQDNNVTEFVLIQLSDSNNEASSIQKAIGMYVISLSLQIFFRSVKNRSTRWD